MWTGTPYDRWQKRLGVTLFLLAVVPFLFWCLTGRDPSAPVMYLLGAISLMVFGAMGGLLAAKKLYFFLAGGRTDTVEVIIDPLPFAARDKPRPVTAVGSRAGS